MKPLDLVQTLSAAGLHERGGVWTDAAGHVGVLRAGVGVVVGRLDVSWPHPSQPEPLLRDAEHLPPGSVERELPAAVRRAAAAWEGAARTCRLCGDRYAPGHMHDADVCQGCAERDLLVVH